jgi:hypothetical protein
VTTTFRVVIPDTSGTHVLLVEDGLGWALPRVTSTERWSLVRSIPIQVRAQFGLEVVVLRGIVVSGEGGSDESPDDEFRFTENVGQDPVDLGGWCTEEELSDRAMTDERDRAAALQWFAERRSGGPELLQPWQREDWFAAAASWVRTTVPDVTSVEQYASWCGSALLRIETAGGRFYFKAAPSYFHDEAAVTAMLAGRFPDVVPRPVAIDVERGWMVLPDFGDALVGPEALEHWEGALDTMRSLQRNSLPFIDELLRGGCRDRRPALLMSQIEVIADGQLDAIPDGYTRRVRDAIPLFAELCAELEGAPIPNTLVHGDFHALNVVIERGRYTIFDWTDACVAHPFVDLLTFFHTFGPPSTDAEVRDRLLDHYVTGWEHLMAHDEAVSLFRRTEPLLTMHHAISYQEILDGLDPTERWQWESHLPWWLDKALDGASEA